MIMDISGMIVTVIMVALLADMVVMMTPGTGSTDYMKIIILHGVRSKILKLGRQSHSKRGRPI